MNLAHAEPAGAAAVGPEELLGLLPLVLAALCYVVAAVRRAGEPRGWPRGRTLSFLTGTALVAVALLAGGLPFHPGDFRGHMQEHLLLGMVAPLFLVLGAPVTLALRSLPARRGRQLGRALRSSPVRLLSHPVAALALNLGGFAALYFSPLLGLMTGSEVVHGLVHLHFFTSGYLFAWVVAGPDPAPHRPSVPARLVVLGVAVAGHAVLAQLLYAGIAVQPPVPAEQRQGAAELMYYGGDLAELALALALLSTWRPRRPARGSAGESARARIADAGRLRPAGR